MEIEPKKLVIGLGLVFVLGVLFAVVNGIYTESTDRQLPLIVYAISFISLLIGALIMLLFQWKISRIQLEGVMRILPVEERTLVKILLDNNRSIEQNRLVALSGFSKVKVSRVTHRLSERGVVEKKSLGNTNLVVLKV
ncbi:hypothetical protein HYU17_05825 [Candidatus Woesearchaeota archaeon]|nr:hypothetical protein [Candidatus Woesearchaeota archaeon]